MVPDLATSVPAPTDGGRAYTFHLRSGVRYSTGELVRASDIRRAVERDIRLKSPGAQYFAGIAGAAACASRPAACDLSHGIVADDGQQTVTIRLTSPDPDFLYKLALPFFSAVPDARVKGLPPATGPYMVRRYVRGRKILLTRNPAFRQWSAAAQPDGFADRILVTLRGSAAQRLAWVERGHSDLDASPPAQALAQLAARFTTQLHVFPGRATNELFVNMRVAPFDDVRARQALNYALDRGTSLSAGGFATATPTCQALFSAELPGLRAVLPVHAEPASRLVERPKSGEGSALVRASGTRGSRVTLWYPSAPPLPGAAPPATVVAALRQMGYRPSLRVVKGLSDYFAKVYSPPHTGAGRLFGLARGLRGWVGVPHAAGLVPELQARLGAREPRTPRSSATLRSTRGSAGRCVCRQPIHPPPVPPGPQSTAQSSTGPPWCRSTTRAISSSRPDAWATTSSTRSGASCSTSSGVR